MFPCLFDGAVIDFHLSWKMLFQPSVLVNAVVQEKYGCLPGNFHRGFAFFPAVEPCFGPPTDTGPIRINADKSRYVEMLHVDVQSGQRVNDPV